MTSFSYFLAFNTSKNLPEFTLMPIIGASFAVVDQVFSRSRESKIMVFDNRCADSFASCLFDNIRKLANITEQLRVSQQHKTIATINGIKTWSDQPRLDVCASLDMQQHRILVRKPRLVEWQRAGFEADWFKVLNRSESGKSFNRKVTRTSNLKYK